MDNQQELVNLLTGMLKEKHTVIETIGLAIDESKRIETGLSKAKDSVLDNPSDANLRKMLNVTMKSLETQSKTITQLSLISLVYVANDNFTSDVAKILAKLGHGNEAIREMFRQKMNGN